MKILLIFLAFLTCSVPGFSQVNKTSEGKPGILKDSTVVDKIRQLKDSLAHNVDSIEDSLNKARLQSDAERNINSILALQEKQRQKQKRAAMIRIAIGVGLLAILIIGLLRRRRIK